MEWSGVEWMKGKQSENKEMEYDREQKGEHYLVLKSRVQKGEINKRKGRDGKGCRREGKGGEAAYWLSLRSITKETKLISRDERKKNLIK